jgi:hypothetical protein
MTRSPQHFESASYGLLELEDDRIMIDIETDRIIRSQMQSTTSKGWIPHFEGRTLGPLAVLLILAFYALVSPLLSPSIHEYISRILH